MDKFYLREYAREERQEFTLGLALSGGGARGFAHAGALKAIEEAGLKIDVISGVSAGSIIAVLYAAGLKPDTILDMFKEATFFDLAEFSVGKGGLLKIDKFIRYCTRCLGKIKKFEDLSIPTYIGVTNFDKGEAVAFSSGDIAPVIKASCSIPVAMVPVKMNSTTYVDGGVVRNLPAWTIRDKCDKLIGISVSPLLEKKTVPTLFGMAMRSYSLLARSNQAQDMALCDLTVRMDEVTKHNIFSLKEIEEVYEAGYLKMKEILNDSELSKLT